jgi:hypothetical protein
MAMWKCPKCGEQLEGQFDSCWKCAAGPGESGSQEPPGKLKGLNYLWAAFISALAPALAILIQSLGYAGGSNQYRALLNYIDKPFFWLITAAEWLLTVAVFFLFRAWLTRRAERWILFGCCCSLWYLAALMITPGVHR